MVQSGPAGPSETGSGISANFDQMRWVAGLVEQLAASVDTVVTVASTAMSDLRLVPAIIAAPLVAVGAEARLLDTCDGPRGLRLDALELHALHAVLGEAVTLYRDADDAQTWLALHPDTMNLLIRAIDTASGRSEPQIAGWLARFYPDGEAQVSRVGSFPDTPPRSIVDLMAALSRRAHISSASVAAPPASSGSGVDDGTIDVRRLVGPAGVAWIVDLAGTSRWDVVPGLGTSAAAAHDPADFGADVRLMAGESTAYSRGVVEAVSSLPIKPGQPVMLTGHSEGGMVAMAAAGALVGRGVDVRSVLTAGSPIAELPRPPGVDVLALVNSDDIVPRIDPDSNPADTDETTLTFGDQLGSVGANHGFGAYSLGAADADRSDDPGVVRWRQRARPFLTATSARMFSFRIRRVP